MGVMVAYSPSNPTGQPSEPNWFKRALGASADEGVDRHRVIGLVILVVALLLVLQNTKSAELHFLFFTFRAPIWIMAVATLVLGAVGWELVKRSRRRRHAEAVDATPTTMAAAATASSSAATGPVARGRRETGANAGSARCALEDGTVPSETTGSSEVGDAGAGRLTSVSFRRTQARR